jgi:hypothetical protein
MFFLHKQILPLPMSPLDPKQMLNRRQMQS